MLLTSVIVQERVFQCDVALCLMATSPVNHQASQAWLFPLMLSPVQTHFLTKINILLITMSLQKEGHLASPTIAFFYYMSITLNTLRSNILVIPDENRRLHFP